MKKGQMIRIRTYFLLAVCAVSLMLSGCTTQKPEEQIVKEEIEIWHYWEDFRMKEALNAIVTEFNQSQKKIEVSAQYVPAEDFKKQLALSMADQTMPDLAIVDSSDFQYFHSVQPFVDLTDEIPQIMEMVPEAKASCQAEGRMMGLPIGMNCSVLYYNVELLKAAGIVVPQTVADLYDAAVRLSSEERYGFLISTLRSEESVYSFLPLLWAEGGTVDTLNSSESYRAFEVLKYLSESGALSRQSINLNAGDLTKQFATGKVAMMITSSSVVNTIRQMNPKLEFDITCPPRKQSGECYPLLGGEIIGISQGEHEEASIEFLKFFSEPERMQKFEEHSGLLSPFQDIRGTQYHKDPILRKTKEIAALARTREFSKEWPAVSKVLTEAIEEIVIGQRTETEILQEASEKIVEIRKAAR